MENIHQTDLTRPGRAGENLTQSPMSVHCPVWSEVKWEQLLIVKLSCLGTNDKLLHISKLVGGEWKCIQRALPTTFDAIYYICDLWLTI